jgi:tRNA (cmo5U34)-methyltransferase
VCTVMDDYEVGTDGDESRRVQTAGWSADGQVDWYLNRIGGLAPRLAGEEVLRSILPPSPKSCLDLGCGDGRLTDLALDACPSLDRVLAVDNSPAMLERARARFQGDRRVEVAEWHLDTPITPLGRFDLVVAGFAIHHVEDARKYSLFQEIALQLEPGGRFANLEVVASATPELHAEFLSLIGRVADDPADRLRDVESQLQWMRAAGFIQVDCVWRWRGFALLIGSAP